jgi:hypothetical protein
MVTVRVISEEEPRQSLRTVSTNGLGFLFVFDHANVPQSFLSKVRRFEEIAFP